jgi:hypothetical protein
MEERPDEDRTRANIAALAIIAALLVGGYFLVRAAVNNARLQECLARHYINCAPVDAPPERN